MLKGVTQSIWWISIRWLDLLLGAELLYLMHVSKYSLCNLDAKNNGFYYLDPSAFWLVNEKMISRLMISGETHKTMSWQDMYKVYWVAKLCEKSEWCRFEPMACSTAWIWVRNSSYVRTIRPPPTREYICSHQERTKGMTNMSEMTKYSSLIIASSTDVSQIRKKPEISSSLERTSIAPQ